jgi:signal transduction histidine kinase
VFREFVHDVRTPIAVIAAGLDLIVGHGDEASERRVASMHLALGHLQAVLLRAESALAPVSSSPALPVDVAAVAAGVAEQLQPLFDSAGVTLELTGLPAAACAGDEVALRRVLVNVLANACRYSPRGTTVRVEVVHDDAEVHVTVSDCGPGFEAAASAADGWGIGLLVSAGLMAAMGGRLVLGGSSRGAVVDVVLPA